jgi:O-antigen/teichoic acid export membrane protein
MIYTPRLKGSDRTLYTGSTLLHQLVLCFLTILTLISGIIIIEHGIGPRDLIPVLWALVAIIEFIMLREYARRVYFTCLKVKKVLLLDTSVAINQIIGLLLLAKFKVLTASRVYWVFGFASGVAVIGWLWFERNHYRLQIDESIADLKKNWTFGKWIFASGLVLTVGVNLYPWLLAFFYGTASTGVWAVCLGIIALGNPFVLGVQNFLGPRIIHQYTEYDGKSLRRFVLKTSAIFALLMLIFSLVMIFLGDPLVSWIYGVRYTGNSLVVTLLAFNAGVNAVAFLYSRALLAIERAYADFLINFMTLFIMATLGFWLVESLGLLGAAFGLLGGSLVTLVMRSGYFLMLSCNSTRRVQ